MALFQLPPIFLKIHMNCWNRSPSDPSFLKFNTSPTLKIKSSSKLRNIFSCQPIVEISPFRCRSCTDVGLKMVFVSSADFSLSWFRSSPAGFARYTASFWWWETSFFKMNVAQDSSELSLLIIFHKKDDTWKIKRITCSRASSQGQIDRRIDDFPLLMRQLAKLMAFLAAYLHAQLEFKEIRSSERVLFYARQAKMVRQNAQAMNVHEGATNLMWQFK